MNPTAHTKGRMAEELVYSFLDRQGLKLLEKNYRTPRGEIDLIMQDGEVTVFIEVRSRNNNRTMNVLESIDNSKCAHIINASEYYLQHNKRLNHTICRFDIVLLTGELHTAEVEWIKNAFEV